MSSIPQISKKNTGGGIRISGAQKAFAAFERDIQNIQQAQNAWRTRQPRHPCEQIDETKATSSNGTYIDVMA
jgi:hypothetical protein